MTTRKEMTGMATATPTTLGVRDEFVNESDGWVGVVQIGPHGEQKGTAVEPGGNVWLTEDEQILTANAPRADKDNPFTNGSLTVRTRGAQVKSRRPYGAGAAKPHIVSEEPVIEPGDVEETGATPVPDEEPEVGQAAPHEEVATPAAAMRPKPDHKPTRRRRA